MKFAMMLGHHRSDSIPEIAQQARSQKLRGRIIFINSYCCGWEVQKLRLQVLHHVPHFNQGAQDMQSVAELKFVRTPTCKKNEIT